MLFIILFSTFISFGNCLPIVDDDETNYLNPLDWNNVCSPFTWGAYHSYERSILVWFKVSPYEQITCFHSFEIFLRKNDISLQYAKIYTLPIDSSYYFKDFRDLELCTSYEITIRACANHTHCFNQTYQQNVKIDYPNCTVDLEKCQYPTLNLTADYDSKDNSISVLFNLRNLTHQHCFKNYRVYLEHGYEPVRMVNIDTLPNNEIMHYNFYEIQTCRNYQVVIQPCLNLTYCIDRYYRYRHVIPTFYDSCRLQVDLFACEKYKLTINPQYDALNRTLTIQLNFTNTELANCFKYNYVFLKREICNKSNIEFQFKSNNIDSNKYTFYDIDSCHVDVMILPCYDYSMCSYKGYKETISINTTQCINVNIPEIIH